MSAQSHDPRPTWPDKTPAGIRACLLPEDLDEFDAEFHQVMSEATASYDLNGVNDFVQRWYPVAVSSLDPQSHRRMLETARKLNAGEHVPTEPWEETRRRLGI
ncbi:hypothetical protein FOE78_04235 [Microlunatus elymi]|uniref:Uncharacterized protein n=1 Tax=Microlunatus elymi TaxID=2596828 RepID=A0A516PVL1_9ACTN|nr:DUF6247 family protein [Microlunatus elymi]QDP95224.1 hypothetical protein FOE78_04235 [Microlunatus elymi]